jgi:predicted RNase H-like nuclease
MRTVLGIDAAWTETHTTGLALIEEAPSGWRLRAVASSYGHFHASALDPRPEMGRPIGSRPDAGALLAACRALTGQAPDLVAVDMPLSRKDITGRRPCDKMVSETYGAKKCATHSPSAERPGQISKELREGLEAYGYALWTAPDPPRPTLVTPGLIEVYPHPALVELTDAAERLPYKVGKIGKYWPKLEPSQRRGNVRAQWKVIVTALDDRIEGVRTSLPEIAESASGLALKSYEDRLDAIVCAWVGVCALEGVADAIGDLNAAIWIPSRKRGWPNWRASSPAM